MSKVNIDGGNERIYADNLVLSLLLESDGDKKEIYSGNIEKFDLEYNPYGFEASVHFSGFDDKDLEKVFNSEKPITATFTYQTVVQKAAGKDPVTLKGTVSERESRGLNDDSQKPTLVYQIRFCDGAQESWSYHFPKAIYIEKTMKDVIDAEKNSLVNVEYDWDALTEEHPILAYSLEDDHHLPKEERVSFYSFLFWYLQQEGGVLEYNYKDDKYKILGKKSVDGDPIPVAEWWITPPRTVHPTPSRWVNKSLKSFPDRLEDEVDEVEEAYAAVRKDWYDDATYVQFSEQNREKIKSSLIQEKPEATFWIKEFDETFQFDQLIPGVLFSFKGREKIKGLWCEHPVYKGKTFRVKKVKMRGEKKAQSELENIEAMPYECTIRVVAEDKDETFIPRPQYRVPKFPFSALGEIFSDIGEEEQTTFNVAKDEDAPLGKYQVKIPLSGEEEKYVIVPFTPDFMTGQHYFPFCKNQQVMLAMEFKTAKIQRALNWQPLTELPEKTQGCQVVYASDGASKYFFQKHEFEDGKNSVMTIKQSSSETQTQVITIKEKDVTITVEEKDKRTTLIQFNRDSGLLIKVEDKDAEITNSTLYDDKAITHTSKGSGGTSTVVQKPESLEITADKIVINCKDFSTTAEKVITHNAASKILLDTPLTKATQELTVG